MYIVKAPNVTVEIARNKQKQTGKMKYVYWREHLSSARDLASAICLSAIFCSPGR